MAKKKQKKTKPVAEVDESAQDTDEADDGPKWEDEAEKPDKLVGATVEEEKPAPKPEAPKPGAPVKRPRPEDVPGKMRKHL